MGLKFWKKEAVKNDIDLESMTVMLPLSKKEMTISEIVNALDKIENMHGYASDDHMVKIGENEMSVKKLASSYQSLNEELEGMKSKENGDDEDMDESMDNEDEDMEDKEKKKNKKKNATEEDEEAIKNALAVRVAAKAKADRLKNAAAKHDAEEAARLKKENGESAPEYKVEFMADQVERGKERY